MFKLNPLVAAISIAIVSPMAAFAADTGDAPASYGLAEHEILPASPYIGEQSPDNNDPVNSQDALGDDNGNVVDDEDGVFAFPQLVENAKSMNVNVFVSNPSTQDATLVGWIDFDGNGTFEADEAATAIVPAGSNNVKIKLLWPDTFGISTDYDGQTYARFRISNDPLQLSDSMGSASNGEVEDYTLTIQQDSDGDEIPDTLDLDNDNDGIPDAVEGTTIDTDGDGTFDYLDVDSDDDSIPDYAEAGPDANNPQDTDGDSTPDYLDTDSNNDGVADIAGDANDSDSDGIADSIEGSIDTDGDGIINSLDIDSDNDLIPDSVEIGVSAPNPVDTDGDLIPDYLDLDSDNDGIPDLYESNTNEISIEVLDTNVDGQVDTGQVFGANGYVDDVETGDDTGVPIFAIPDTDGDGVRDFRDTDSDADGTFDVVESGGADADNNGLVDDIVDTNGNGVPDAYDFTVTGGVDTDGDGIDDSVDASFVDGADADNDGIIDSVDLDINGDGMVDSVVSNATNDLFRDGVLPDVDGDFNPDFRDQDSVAGPTSGATTGATDTTGGTTTGTTGGTPVEPTTTTTGGSTTDGIVETGLSGSACSISDAPGRDPLFPGLVLMSATILFMRRKLFGSDV